MLDQSVVAEVLARIAAAHHLEPSSLHIGDKGAVYYSRNGDLLCLCQRGSTYWNEIAAVVLTEKVIATAQRR